MADEFWCTRVIRRQRRRRDLPNRSHRPFPPSPRRTPGHGKGRQHRGRAGRTTVPAENHSVHQIKFHFNWGVYVARIVCVFARPSQPLLLCDGNDSSRWIRPPSIPQTTLPAIPRSRTARSPTLLRTGSDQVHGIIGGSTPNLFPPRPVSPSVGTARKGGDGIRRI